MEFLKYLLNNIISYKDIFDVFEAIATSLGIFVAGLWTYQLFIRKRIGYPKINIDLLVNDIILPEDARLVHAEIKIKNIGNVILKSDKAELRLRQVIRDVHAERALPMQSLHERSLL